MVKKKAFGKGKFFGNVFGKLPYPNLNFILSSLTYYCNCINTDFAFIR